MDDAAILPNGPEVLRSARTSAHRSIPKQRVEGLTRGARRNGRPEEKREIALREGKLGHLSAPVLNFAQAVVTQTQTLAASEVPLPMSGHPAAPSRRQKPRGPSINGELIEIALPNGMVVRVGADVDQAALARVAPTTSTTRGEQR